MTLGRVAGGYPETLRLFEYCLYYCFLVLVLVVSFQEIIIIQKINCSAHISTLLGACLKARIQKHRGKPILFHDECSGFFYVHYTTHGTYSFTSYPKDEAIMVKCFAQGHKRRDPNALDRSATTLRYKYRLA